MAVKTNAIVEGEIVRRSERSGKNANGDWKLVELLIVGDHTLANVVLGRDVPEPPKGASVRGVIEVGVYRDDDSVTLIEWLDKAAK